MNRRGFLSTLVTVTLAAFMTVLPRFGGEDEPEFIPEKKRHGWTAMNMDGVGFEIGELVASLDPTGEQLRIVRALRAGQ